MAKSPFKRHIRNLIADLRSLPREESTASLRRPRKIGTVAEVVIKNFAVRSRCEDVLLENWATVVGGNFSSRCSPHKILPSDVLIIRCSNAVIRSELALVKATILENIAKLPRCKHIRDVRFQLA
ncbi:MAG: DUF721 domain-containing protein [Puniceicoccales bacterium]|jgi:hypothetical protein|nr:DUF721 domain-containing protein [Puniceicoccales bacterium]